MKYTAEIGRFGHVSLRIIDLIGQASWWNSHIEFHQEACPPRGMEGKKPKRPKIRWLSRLHEAENGRKVVSRIGRTY